MRRSCVDVGFCGSDPRKHPTAANANTTVGPASWPHSLTIRNRASKYAKHDRQSHMRNIFQHFSKILENDHLFEDNDIFLMENDDGA